MKNIKYIAFGLISAVAAQTASAAEYGAKDIVDVAASNEDFSTLVAAVKAADLVDTLKSEGPFTVLAPTNAAFAKLPEGTVENLLKPENKDQLTAILTYHVIAGNNPASAVVTLGQCTYREWPERHHQRRWRHCQHQQCHRDSHRYRSQQWCDSRDRHGFAASVRLVESTCWE